MVQPLSKNLAFLLARALSVPLKSPHVNLAAAFLYVALRYDQAARCAGHMLLVGLSAHGFWLLRDGLDCRHR